MPVIDQRIVHIFDQMEGVYDDLTDLWYAWLFSRLHFFIAQDIITGWRNPSPEVLDVGCGTGFQSFLYAHAGARVQGIDISDGLVKEAAGKAQAFDSRADVALFPPHFAFVQKYDKRINALLRARRTNVPACLPQFGVASATDIPAAANSVDHVNCCGSVLSFVEDYPRALDEIARVLRPGGTLIMEAEGRWNGDAIWPVVDILLRGKLQYEMSVEETRALLRRPWSACVRTEYPFGEVANPVYMPINLFTRRLLNRELRKRGLMPRRWRSVHSFTNVLPSTFLDSPNSGIGLRRAFAMLASIEEHAPGYWPGCSIVVTCSKGS